MRLRLSTTVVFFEGSDELIPFHELEHKARAYEGSSLKMICIVVIVVTIIIVVLKVM